MADYIYLVQMDVPAEKEADFNRIYDYFHKYMGWEPDRVRSEMFGAGFSGLATPFDVRPSSVKWPRAARMVRAFW